MSTSKSKSLIFNCVVADGMGMYSELDFPSHPMWPEKMQAGSLNARINSDGFPKSLDKMGKSGYGVQKLDNKKFSSLFNIAQQDIGNNSLGPTPQEPERGIAQVWKCSVSVDNSHVEFDAWMVRRIGSAYMDVIELMSDKHLRDSYGLQSGMPITLKVHEGENNETKRSNGWFNKIKNILG